MMEKDVIWQDAQVTNNATLYVRGLSDKKINSPFKNCPQLAPCEFPGLCIERGNCFYISLGFYRRKEDEERAKKALKDYLQEGA
jgi:hypothetical protein